MRKITCCIGLTLVALASTAVADKLTLTVEQELSALGYDTGPVDGEETMETVIAVSKYQAENQLEVTGEITPQLAGILSARASGGNAVGSAKGAEPAVAAAPSVRSPAELQAAQQACLQEKIAAAQDAKKKKRGLGRLMSAVARTAGHLSNHTVSNQIGNVYSANATAADLSAAAKDLGLTEDDVAACQHPEQ